MGHRSPKATRSPEARNRDRASDKPSDFGRETRRTDEHLRGPAILSDLEPHAVALLGEYGASDRVIVDALLGRTPFVGTLPFDLPRSMNAVEASREDVPYDTAQPLYLHGHGLTMATTR